MIYRKRENNNDPLMHDMTYECEFTGMSYLLQKGCSLMGVRMTLTLNRKDLLDFL